MGMVLTENPPTQTQDPSWMCPDSKQIKTFK